MAAEDLDETRLALPSGAPTVLVAEDEILIRLIISDHLRQSGFTVIEAASAKEAETALGAIGTIDAVFSDLNVPLAADGVELILWMAQDFPNLPVILTSGGASPAEAMTIASCANVTDFLPKPYDAAEVERLLRMRIAAAAHG